MGATAAVTIVPKSLSEYTDIELADLFGDADLKVQQRENAEAKRDKYRGELQRRFDAALATEEHFVDGDRWHVRLSPRRKESQIKSAWAVYKALKLNVHTLVDLAMRFVPLYFLEEKLGREKLDALIDQGQTGYRTVKAVMRPDPVSRAA